MNSNRERGGNPSFGDAWTSPFVSSGVRPSPQSLTSTSIPVDTLITGLQRVETKLDASDRRAFSPRPTPQPDPNPIYGMPWEWQSPSWAPEGILTSATAVTLSSQPLSSTNGWPHPDSLSRGSATQHTGFVSRPADVYPSTSWDHPLQQQGGTGFRPYEGLPPTSWDRPTTRVGEFHDPRSYGEPTAPSGTSTQVTSSAPLSPTSSSSSAPASMEAILARIARLAARLEARLEAKEQRWAPAFPPPRVEAAPPFGSPDWRFPTWDPGSRQATTPAVPIFATSLPAVQHQPQPLPAPYAPPPPPSRDGCYVPPLPSYTSPQQSRGSSCFVTTPNDARDTTAAGREGERGVSGLVEEESLMVEGENIGAEATIEADAIYELTRSTTPLESEEEFIGDESEEAPVYDVRKKTLELADELMACEFVVAKEGEELDIERVSVYFNLGGAVLYQAQEEVVLLGFIPNKKGEGSMKKKPKSREVSRRPVMFGIYALDEVYKDLLNLHLEDKVILKGGGVDTLFILINCN